LDHLKRDRLPERRSGADLGFRLHKTYWHYTNPTPVPGDYMPDYTNAAYAEPAKGDMNGAYNSTGMSGWCNEGLPRPVPGQAGLLNSFGTSE